MTWLKSIWVDLKFLFQGSLISRFSNSTWVDLEWPEPALGQNHFFLMKPCNTKPNTNSRQGVVIYPILLFPLSLYTLKKQMNIDTIEMGSSDHVYVVQWAMIHDKCDWEGCPTGKHQSDLYVWNTCLSALNWVRYLMGALTHIPVNLKHTSIDNTTLTLKLNLDHRWLLINLRDSTSKSNHILPVLSGLIAGQVWFSLVLQLFSWT